MDILTTVELWQIMEKHSIVRVTLLLIGTCSSPPSSPKRNLLNIFWQTAGIVRELRSDLGNQGDTPIKDLFIANMQDPEIHKQSLRETLEPAQALRITINMELAQRNLLQISNAHPASLVNAITPQRPFRQSNQRQNVTAAIR